MTSEVRYQDDLYQAVNGAWMKQAVIPDDKSSTGGFQDLADEVEEKMMADFAAVSDRSRHSCWTALPILRTTLKRGTRLDLPRLNHA